MRVRHFCAALCAGCVLVLGGLGTAGRLGLRVNMTSSMPVGLWHVRAGAGEVARGAVVIACPPPAVGPILEGARRGYIGVGPCPGGLQPLLKPVAAVGGDLVVVTAAGVVVNDQAVPGTAPLDRDSAGRKLQPVPAGAYRVPLGQLWLLSGHDPRSFDSRYFGPVPAAAVQGVARPVLVLR